MVTKGVASVRSPVQNLCAFKPEVKHESFLKAVISSFQSEYGINDEVDIQHCISHFFIVLR